MVRSRYGKQVPPRAEGYTPWRIAGDGERRVSTVPEWLIGIVQSGLTVIALIVIVMLLAALFMIIFGIATGIDERIQE